MIITTTIVGFVTKYAGVALAWLRERALGPLKDLQARNDALEARLADLEAWRGRLQRSFLEERP